MYSLTKLHILDDISVYNVYCIPTINLSHESGSYIILATTVCTSAVRQSVRPYEYLPGLVA